MEALYSMRIIKVVFIFILFLSLQTAQGIKDNFYFTIEPEKEFCLPVNIPQEFLSFDQGLYTINLTTDLETNFRYIQTEASGKNTIEFPLCFSARGKKEGDFSEYYLDLSPSRRVRGGVCITNISGVNIISNLNKSSPCSLINSHIELIDLSIVPSTYYTGEGEGKLSLYLKSPEDIDVEIDLKSNLVQAGKQIARLEKNRIKKIELPFNAQKGNYYVNASAQVIFDRKYCEFPFCTARARGEVFVDGVRETGWKADIPFVIQSLNSPGKVEFIINIRNFEEARDFEIEILDSPGVRSNIRKETYKVGKGENKGIVLEFTPEVFEAGIKTVDVIIRGDTEKRERLYIMMKEASSDLKRLIQDLDLDKQEKDKILSILNKIDSFDPQKYTDVYNILNDTETKPPEVKVEKQDIDPLYIVIPLVVLIIVLVFFLFKKRKSV